MTAPPVIQSFTSSLPSLMRLFSHNFSQIRLEDAQTPQLPHVVFLGVKPELAGILGHPTLRQKREDQSEDTASL